MFQQYYSSICLHCEHIFTTAQQQPSCPTHHLEQTSNTPITRWIGQRHVTTMSWLFPIKAKCWDTPFELRNLAEAIIHHQEIRDLSYRKSQLAISELMPHSFLITIIASRRFTSYTVLIISWPWWFKLALLLLSNRLSNVSLKSVTWIKLYFACNFPFDTVVT